MAWMDATAFPGMKEQPRPAWCRATATTTSRIAVRDTRDYERLLREKLYSMPGIRHLALRAVRAQGSEPLA
jgi:hypothetical protein